MSTPKKEENVTKLQHEEKEEEEEKEGVLDWYNQKLDTNPVITKAVTAALVQGFGSIIGSLLSHRHSSSSSSSSSFPKTRVLNVETKKKKVVDWMDVLAFMIHGGLINGPVGHYWFEYLAKHGPKSKSYSMLLDQLVVQPPLLVFMFVFLDITKKMLKEVGPSYRRTMEVVGPTIVTSWRFWPLAVYCTFRYLKKKHYTVALNLCSVAWTIYLSKGQQQQQQKGGK